jgi:hypothetical protein
MKTTRWLAICLGICLSVGTFTACNKSDTDKAKDTLQDAGEKTKDALKDAANKTGDALNKAGEKIKDATSKTNVAAVTNK